MIELYAAHTPNGWRAAIALAESGLPYRVHSVDLERKSPEFLALAPHGAIPVMREGALVLSQSGAILLHVAERVGRFLPSDPSERAAALEWMLFACSDAAAASGLIYTLEKDLMDVPSAHVRLAEDRMLTLFRHADRRLATREYLADELSVADLALIPLYHWRRSIIERAGDLAHLDRWARLMTARAGVARGLRLD